MARDLVSTLYVTWKQIKKQIKLLVAITKNIYTKRGCYFFHVAGLKHILTWQISKSAWRGEKVQSKNRKSNGFTNWPLIGCPLVRPCRSPRPSQLTSKQKVEIICLASNGIEAYIGRRAWLFCPHNALKKFTIVTDLF